MHMNKQGTQVFLVKLLLLKRHWYIGVEGRWLINRPKHSVPETQTTALRLELTLLIYFPHPIAREIIVMSFYDVMIICSTLLVGKPLCMCKGNAIIHLHICWHCHQNLQLLPLHPNDIIFSLSWISCLWHSPLVFQCSLVLESEIYLQHLQHLRMDTNTGMYK